MSMETRIVNDTGLGRDTRIIFSDKDLTKILPITNISLSDIDSQGIIKVTINLDVELLLFDFKNVITKIETNLSKKDLGTFIEELQRCYYKKQEEK